MTASQKTRYKVAVVQAAPAFLDLARGVDKAIGLIEEAARNGASLVAFPEVWLPGYPWWIWLDSPAWGMKFVQRYFENALVVDSPEWERLRAAAAANRVRAEQVRPGAAGQLLRDDLRPTRSRWANPVGHCSRPDVLRLLFSSKPAPRVHCLRAGPGGTRGRGGQVAGAGSAGRAGAVSRRRFSEPAAVVEESWRAQQGREKPWPLCASRARFR